MKRSVADVNHHLALLTVGDGLIEMVKTDEVAATTAVALAREQGVQASKVAQQQLEKVKIFGKKKLTRAEVIPKFNSIKAIRLLDILINQKVDLIGGKNCILLEISISLDVMGIINVYEDFILGR